MAGSPEFSAIFAMGPTEATVIGILPSDRRVPDEARRTDSSGANSGGTARPSSKRYVVGSRYFFAKRCVVGSQVGYYTMPNGRSWQCLLLLKIVSIAQSRC
jgi:hypothetical protein